MIEIYYLGINRLVSKQLDIQEYLSSRISTSLCVFTNKNKAEKCYGELMVLFEAQNNNAIFDYKKRKFLFEPWKEDEDRYLYSVQIFTNPDIIDDLYENYRDYEVYILAIHKDEMDPDFVVNAEFFLEEMDPTLPVFLTWEDAKIALKECIKILRKYH